jgi:phosphoribosylglycinamide formyltransferase 2
MQKKILLLGSGELGKEVVIALQRLGQRTCDACSGWV